MEVDADGGDEDSSSEEEDIADLQRISFKST